MSKNPSWIQFSDDAWGEAVGPSEYDKFLDSLDAPTLPIQSLEPLPDHDAPLLLTWITEHLAELAADEQFRVIGPHGLTFHQHADKLMEVAHLDAARRSATGDLRDQLTGQHRDAKQELDDFERSEKFQSALRYCLEAAGPAFERIASAPPESQAAVVRQQQAAVRHEALKALVAKLGCAAESPEQGEAIKQQRPPQKKKRDYVANAVDSIEAFCAAEALTFDRQFMPGDAGDLLWLLAKLHPEHFEGMQIKAFRDHYKGVCSWPHSAGHQDGAKSLYSNAFPEIRPRIAGVIPIIK